MSKFNISKWANSLKGKALDLDGAPRANPVQCHDVWLSYLYALGGEAPMGFAPGNGYTHNVFTSFPYDKRLENIFTKHNGIRGLRRGDVLFWSAYREGGGLPHVAVVLDPPSGGKVRVVSQDAGKRVEVTHLYTSGAIGYLRPKRGVTPRPGASKPPQDTPGGTYTVKRGDTLSAIAGRYGTTWQALAKLNGISNANLIHPGQKLRVPASTYVVKRGDTLSGIAGRYDTTWQKLKSLNGIKDANKIYPGQKIKLR